MEVKWGSYFTNLGFPIEKILVDVLKKEKVPKDIVFIESFDQRSLQRLNQVKKNKIKTKICCSALQNNRFSF